MLLIFDTQFTQASNQLAWASDLASALSKQPAWRELVTLALSLHSLDFFYK